MEFTLEDVLPPQQTFEKLDPMNRNGAKLLEVWRDEVDSYYEEMIRFQYLEPDEVFAKLSSWTARISYIRTQIVRHENRVQAAFRTKEIDPFLAECDRQFKIWSRAFSVYSLDWNLAGRGQV
jgi:hypothetical protein